MATVYSWLVEDLRKELGHLKGREFVDAAIDYVWKGWGTVAPFRWSIGEACGRTLLCKSEVEECLNGYRGLWMVREYPSWATDRPEPREIPHIDYGSLHKQRWWLLRDVVIATREVRQRAHRARHCYICGRRLERWQHRYPNEFEFSRTAAFLDAVAARFFSPPDWEFRYRHGQRYPKGTKFNVEYARLQNWARAYVMAQKEAPGKICCGPQCEATHFARWYGVQQMQLRQQQKEERREKEELKCLKKGQIILKKLQQHLRNPQQYPLNPKAWPLPREASRRESSSLSL